MLDDSEADLGGRDADRWFGSVDFRARGKMCMIWGSEDG